MSISRHVVFWMVVVVTYLGLALGAAARGPAVQVEQEMGTSVGLGADPEEAAQMYSCCCEKLIVEVAPGVFAIFCGECELFAEPECPRGWLRPHECPGSGSHGCDGESPGDGPVPAGSEEESTNQEADAEAYVLDVIDRLAAHFAAQADGETAHTPRPTVEMYPAEEGCWSFVDDTSAALWVESYGADNAADDSGTFGEEWDLEPWPHPGTNEHAPGITEDHANCVTDLEKEGAMWNICCWVICDDFGCHGVCIVVDCSKVPAQADDWWTDCCR